MSTLQQQKDINKWLNFNRRLEDEIVSLRIRYTGSTYFVDRFRAASEDMTL